ncbi:MAG: SpoIIE family protein phosphatase [Bacteroidota bacterium]|nr:SpoIIE family protein phosphatase [Bacteroidota bacterium]
MKTKNIASRISIYVLIIVTMVFVVITSINYTVSRRILLDKTRISGQLVQERVHESIENRLINITSRSVELSQINLENYPGGDEGVGELLKTFVGGLDGVSVCVVTVGHGSEQYLIGYNKIYDTVFIAETIRYVDKRWFKSPIETGEIFWSEPHFGLLGKELKMITVSVPIFTNGKASGIVGIRISLDWLDQLVSSIKVFDSGFAFLISKEHTLLTYLKKDYIMTRKLEDLTLSLSDDELKLFLADIDSGLTGTILINEPDVLDESLFIMHHPLELLEGTLLVVIPANEVLGDLKKLTLELFTVSLLAILLIGVFVFIVVRRFLNPLKKLNTSVKLFGEGEFDVHFPEPKVLDEVGMLSQSFIRMKDNLIKNELLLEQSTEERQKIETQIDFAARLQNSILPQKPPVALKNSGIDIFGLLKPAKKVGGDLYDYFISEDKLLYFIVGDVTGKGIPASFFMGMTRTYFRVEGKYNRSVKELMNKVNQDLCQTNTESIFVTLFCGILDLETWQLEYCNAGHNLPRLIKKDGSVKRISEQHGSPLGLMLKQNYNSSQMILEPGDKFIGFTDGVTEASNKDGAFFGKSEMGDLFKKSEIYDKSAKETCSAVFSSVKEFSGREQQEDDITILVFQRTLH